MHKNLLVVLMSTFLITSVYAADQVKKEEPSKKEEKAPSKKEKVCIDKVKDNNKSTQVCKEVKVHEKLDGHKVPDKK